MAGESNKNALKTDCIGIPAFAEMVGLTPTYIRRLIKQGKIEKSAVEKHGKRDFINPVLAVKHLEKNISYVNKRELKEEQPESSDFEENEHVENLTGIPKLSDSQAKKEYYKAQEAKLDFEIKQGKWLNREKTEQEFFDIARLTRDAILNVPDRISAELASIADPHLINHKMTEELIKALEELSRE